MPHGGDQILVGYLIRELRKLGVEIEHIYGGGLAGKLAHFDLAHIVHINCSACRTNFRAVGEAKVPYVVTPMFFPEVVDVPREEQARWLEGARCVMPFSNAENAEIRTGTGALYSWRVIPSGTDPRFHAEPSDDRVGVCASDWNGTKFTGTIKCACDELGIPFTRFMGQIPDHELPGEYRKYRIFATATTSDRMSLAVGEALCSGCRVISSEANRGNEWYPNLATINPKFPHVVWKERIAGAYRAKDWDYTPNHAARQLTWERTARETAEVYRSVLAF